MATIDISSDTAVCTKCGKNYNHRKNNFSVSYGLMHKGIGYLPICRSCVEGMFKKYLSLCQDDKLAVRQMCRKLDLYWSEKVYDLQKSPPHIH